MHNGAGRPAEGAGRGGTRRGLLLGAGGVAASEALVEAVQQVLGQAVPGAGQELLEAQDGLQAQSVEGGQRRGVRAQAGQLQGAGSARPPLASRLLSMKALHA